MTDPSPLDPFALWRDMVSQMEKGANEFANQVGKSGQFTEGMQKAMSASLTAKKMSDDVTTRYLNALNLPTRADVEALGERLFAIEDRLIAMSAAIERLAGVKLPSTAPAPLVAPRRTKKPPMEETTATAAATTTKKAKTRR